MFDNIEKYGITDIAGYNKSQEELKSFHDNLRQQSIEQLNQLKIKIADAKRQQRARKVLSESKKNN